MSESNWSGIQEAFPETGSSAAVGHGNIFRKHGIRERRSLRNWLTGSSDPPGLNSECVKNVPALFAGGFDQRPQDRMVAGAPLAPAAAVCFLMRLLHPLRQAFKIIKNVLLLARLALPITAVTAGRVRLRNARANPAAACRCAARRISRLSPYGRPCAGPRQAFRHHTLHPSLFIVRHVMPAAHYFKSPLSSPLVARRCAAGPACQIVGYAPCNRQCRINAMILRFVHAAARTEPLPNTHFRVNFGANRKKDVSC